MRIQERWFLIATAASCLLGAVFCATDADTWTTTPGDYDIPGVEPLPTMIIPGSDDIPTVVETKTEFPAKEVDSKLSIDGKKKTVIDFKQKNELKYQKPKDEPTVEETTTWEPTTESTTTEDFETTTEEENIIADQRMVMMDQKLESNLTNGIPLLVQGVPNLVPTLDLVQATSATEIPLMMNITTTESAKKEEDMTTTVETTSSRARALNISAPEPTNSLNTNFTDLSDVSMDDDDKEVEGGEYIAPQNETTMNISSTLLPTTSVCTEGNKTYTLGEKIIRGCDEKCVCGEDGKIMDCKPLCLNPYIRAGRGVQDPLCEEKLIAEEPCCAIMVCAEDSATEPDETCVFGNKTLTRGQKVEDGCSKTCVCEAGGSLKCQPRCPPNDTTSGVTQHDRCVALTDPSDTCCTITLCDVTLGDHELKPENPAEISVNLTDVKVLNSTAIKLKLSTKTPENVTIELSENNHVWRQVRPDKEGIISGLEPAHSYFLRVNENGRLGHALHVSLLAEVIKTNITEKVDKNTCSHRGKTYKIGAEWYDECLSICTCGKDGKADCSTIECPTDFGLDVLDPHCLDWETVPPDFEPKAPNCCPQEVRCRDNGSCTFNDKFYDNWSQLPINVTGCEKRCYCEMGNLTCSDVCPPVADQLSSLNCPPHQATLTHLPGDDCCMHWVCKSPILPGLEHGIHQGFPIAGPPPGFTGQGGQQEVTVQALEALDEHTVRLVFTVPVIFVGLQGRVELRYTGDKMNFDPATWKSQEFAPPDDLIATQQLEFELGDLKPSTEYKVQIIVKLHKLNNTPMSKIYSVRTLDKVPEVSTLPPQIPIDAELRIQDINSTWVNVHWKTLSDYELQFIDGIQLRYKEPDSKIYITTPMIHRKVTNYEIENLKSSTKYEVQIIFIPFPGQTTELISDKKIHFTTSEEPDPYFFSVRAKVDERKSQEVDISWSGVPYPEDKYVNIYRAIYQSDTGKEDTSVFKIAKRDSPAKTTIRDLKPGTRYRLWIEVYLTNGKIKKSNVLDFSTKPGGPAYSGKLASIPLHDGDYYGPLVIVAIVASLAILSTLILLMMLMKRRTSSKADISPRKTTSAYDNPSYKTCEDAVTISNGRNKPAEHEMATINTSANGKETA